ncbi:hypothetical protein CN373_08680 [Bacillus cereus]|uniref:Uncharacterized protein n=2 Tax=Bacillus TaxID=1386 RepID=A0AA44TGC3_BACCE|nr:hypothetical protein CN373_08680 [Bacillus cereus]PFN10020.1 hypothetical protein COJ55_00830 [Bacillus cereus]PFO79876.1 hypothetical protein COJ77_19840 [Bacillus cereus]PFR24627.1 hypothetical protein COK19_17295 [Bacillus cereus]PFS01942.1 hypothetical protein COK38_10395 [Bacillus cereus]
MGIKVENCLVVTCLFGATTLGSSVDRDVTTRMIAENNFVDPFIRNVFIRTSGKERKRCAYVNVHTENHSKGDIRGRIKG